LSSEMSDIEKLKAQINRIYEGLAGIVNALEEIEEAWGQGGKEAATAIAAEKTVKEALSRAKPMREKAGFWMWSRDAPDLKNLLLANNRRLAVSVDGKGYNISIGDSREEKDAFISFWPKSTQSRP